MKIGVVGAGAMGSVYGALFAVAGHEVWLVDVWREHVDAIRAHGLRIAGFSGDRRVHPHATRDPREPGPESGKPTGHERHARVIGSPATDMSGPRVPR